jgi:nucleoside-diphosphate-sugar epimerase
LPRILVTGADGFVGRALCARLRDNKYDVVAVTRRSAPGVVGIGDIGEFTQWEPLLANVTAVIHLAARAHVFSNSHDAAEFPRINVDAAVQLARASANVGVRRFVFLSSIGVNGSSTSKRPFTESDVPEPLEGYAVSKWRAECELMRIASTTAMELVRVRPPLVIGPNVKGNLLRLLQLLDRELPLPFGGVRNLRSYVGLEDLCALLMLCVEHPAAASTLFLAADPEEVSTPELLRRLARGLERKSRLFSVPFWMLQLATQAIGRRKELERMCSSLRVDASLAREVLGWRPAGLDRAIDAMCGAYSRHSGR